LTLFGYLVAEAELPDLVPPANEPTWVVPSNGRQPIRLTRSGFGDWLEERATR
jgi:hypothetical protein